MPPRVMDLTEGTDDYKEWRSIRGIGGSDARSIMGVDPWRTMYQCWLVKTRRATYDITNAAMQRGIDYEPVARKEFEWKMGNDFKEVNLIHQDYPFLRAQVDGWSPDHKTLVEIKVPGKDAHAKALSGHIPEYYIPQLNHELLVSEAEKCAYWSWHPETGGVLIWQNRDEKELAKLLKAELAFWEMIQTDTPPPLVTKDLIIRVDDDWVEAAAQYKQWKETADLAEANVALFKARLIELAEGHSSLGGGVKFVTFHRKGQIDYKAATTELADILGESVDLEKHRRKGTEVTEINVT